MEDVVTMSIDLTVYRGKSVFITGHTGFKGSWLALWLHRLGAIVTGYALAPPSSPSLFDAVGLKDRLRHVHGDVRDPRDLCQALQESQAEFVFHLAAQPLVLRSYRDPLQTFATNLMGTVHLLEAVRRCDSVRAIVNVTSDKCYENREWVWGYRETDAMGGNDPYSASKGCAELAATAYLRSFFSPERHGQDHFIAMGSARAGNVIGGGDWGEDRLVPDCLRAFGAGRPVSVRNPHAVRPWQYVLEPLYGYLLLGSRLYRDGASLSGGWNFGPGQERPHCVGEVVSLLAELWGQAQVEMDPSLRLPEAGLLRLDCSKAHFYLGFSAVMTMRETLEATVAWHKHHGEGADPADLQAFSLDQIAVYERLRSLRAPRVQGFPVSKESR